MRISVAWRTGCWQRNSGKETYREIWYAADFNRRPFKGGCRCGHCFGKEAKSYMDKGELVPDSVVLGMVGRKTETG